MVIKMFLSALIHLHSVLLESQRDSLTSPQLYIYKDMKDYQLFSNF